MAFGLFSPKVGHPALYNDLCKLHEVDRKTRAVLDLIVTTFDLKQPAMIFVDMKWFREAVNHPQFKEHIDLLRELCFRWFGRRI